MARTVPKFYGERSIVLAQRIMLFIVKQNGHPILIWRFDSSTHVEIRVTVCKYDRMDFPLWYGYFIPQVM